MVKQVSFVLPLAKLPLRATAAIVARAAQRSAAYGPGSILLRPPRDLYRDVTSCEAFAAGTMRLEPGEEERSIGILMINAAHSYHVRICDALWVCSLIGTSGGQRTGARSAIHELFLQVAADITAVRKVVHLWNDGDLGPPLRYTMDGYPEVLGPLWYSQPTNLATCWIF